MRLQPLALAATFVRHSLSSLKVRGPLAALLISFGLAMSASAQVPDLTAGGVPTTTTNFNLGPTGLSGWFYHNTDDSSASRQILIQSVDVGSPADGLLAVNDVILGADGTGATPVNFSYDASRELAKAIADAEASNPAELRLLRWRAGATTTVTLTLEYLGAYTATAPYNCPKSNAILQKGLDYVINNNQEAGTFGLGALALMAANDPANPANAARQARAQSDVLALIPPQAEMDDMMAGWIDTESKAGWRGGHHLIVLCEYYLQTGDPQVLPAIEAYAVLVANGQSLLGTYGHQYTNRDAQGNVNGSYNVGYGVVNSSSMNGMLGLILAKECGITNPLIQPGIDRATSFYASYADFGAIPYGEHQPALNLHESNGKMGLAAVALARVPNRVEETKYFVKMSNAASQERMVGHGGSFFNMLWAPLGAAAGGEAAAASHFSRISWHLDMCRRWDGSFAYNHLQHGYQDSGLLAWRGDFPMYGPALLVYAIPRHQLYLTGKGLDPVYEITPADVSAVELAADYDPVPRTTAELVADLGLFSPVVQGKAAAELGNRTAEHATLVPQLLAIANDVNAGEQRVGACLALGQIGVGSAVGDLANLLQDADEEVRFAAATGLMGMPQADQMAHLNTMLTAAANNAVPTYPLDPQNPLQHANYQIAVLLFGKNRVVHTNGLAGIDRNLLYPAIEAATIHPAGLARSTMLNIYPLLTQADVNALSGAIIDAGIKNAPADKMFGWQIRDAGVDTLQLYNYAEGVSLARINAEDKVSNRNEALKALARYAGSSTMVNPDQKIIELCELLVFTDGFVAADAQLVLDAIAADLTPVAPTPLKSIQSVTTDNASLTLPNKFTQLHVSATDIAQGDSIYTWRKVHGAGAVTITPNGTGLAQNPMLVFDGTPGQYLFEVTMSDSRGLTEAVDTVAVTLYDAEGTLPPNSAPTATPQTINIPQSTTTPLILTASDPEGYELSYTVTSQPAHGKLSGEVPYLTYTSDFGYSGPDSFTFEVMDSEGQTSTTTINITVDTFTGLETAIYEPFDYPDGGLNGQSGTSEVGFDGVWAANAATTIDASSSLTHGSLVTAGGKYDNGVGGSAWVGTRAISASALAGNGLLNDGATLWFSLVVGDGPLANGRNAKLSMSLGNSGFNQGNYKFWINNEGTQLGSGVGVTWGYNGTGLRAIASQFRDLSQGDYYNGVVTGTLEDNTGNTPVGEHRLIVGRITWAEDPDSPDRIEIFQPQTTLELPSAPSSVLDVVVDQSTFDTLSFTKIDIVMLDEVRFGANYQSVLAGNQPMSVDLTPPSPDPLVFRTPPTAISSTSITMEVAPAYDPNGVEYYFTCTAGGGHDSGWQSSTSFTDTGLTPGVAYSYTVKARDFSPAANVTTPTAAASATTPTDLAIPSVIGMAESSAAAVVAAFEFSVGTVSYAYNETVPSGKVVSQSPVEDTIATVGSAVNLVVSQGPSPTTPPTIAPINFVDNKSGAMVAAGTLVTYTLTFSKDMDAASVSAADFVNVGTSPVTIGAISETAPGVFTVGVTPTGMGTLQLVIAAGAVLTDVYGLSLDTSSAIPDDTVLIVNTGAVLLGGFHGGNETALQSPLAADVSVTLARTGSSTDITQGYSQISSLLWGSTDLDPDAPTGQTPAELAIVQSGTVPAFTLVTTVTNNGAEDLRLEKIHFIIRRDLAAAPDTGSVSYTSGDLDDVPGGSESFSIPTSNSAYDVALNGFLTDTTLASGESATFTWAHGDPVNPTGNTTLRLDNFAVSGSLIPIVTDTTAPTLASSDIVDDKGGANVATNTLVTYTVTFSEDMDAATVTAADFSNAGTSAVTIGSVTETTPGIFSVQATPTTSGTLRLQVSAGAVLSDIAGNPLDTTVAIMDDTTITVGGSNSAPVASNDAVATDEDTGVAITLVATDADLDSLTYTVVTGPANGSLSGIAPNLTYTPNADFNGSDSFTFTASDDALSSNIATVSLTVTAVNDAPVASNGSASTAVDTAVAITLVANDVDGDPLTYAVVTGPTNGALSGTAPNLTYTPNAAFTGADSFTFTANDGTLTSNVATVDITVNAAGGTILLGGFHGGNETALQSPLANEVSVTLARTGSSTDITQGSSQISSILWGTTDLDVDAPIGQTPYELAIVQTGTTTPFTLVMTVTNNGVDPLSLETIHFIIRRDLDDAPDLGTLTYTSGDLADTAGASSSFAIPRFNTEYDIALNGFLSDTSLAAGESAVFTWSHNAPVNPAGNTTLRLDNFAISGSIAGAPSNTAPVASNGSSTTDEDTAVAITLSATDADLDPLTYTVVTGPANGSLSGTAPNLTYTPNADFNGSDSFTFTASDGTIDSNIATISITVNAVNDAPDVNAGLDDTVTLTGSGGGTPVAGAYFESDAAADTPGDSIWPSTTANSWDWNFDNGVQSPVAVSDARFDTLSVAYIYPAAKDSNHEDFQTLIPGSDQEPATFEFVLDVDGNDGVIFETGGNGDGFAVDVAGGVLRAMVEEDPTDAVASYALTPTDLGRFIHVVVVVDMVNDLLQLYVDGSLADSQPWTAGEDWSGTDNGGLGAKFNSIVDGGSTVDFTGKIALVRYYKNKAFNATEVTTNFDALSSGAATAVAALDGTVTDADTGDTVTTTWSVFSGPGVVVFDAATAVDTSATFDTAGIYVLRLTADDGTVQSFDDVTITVNEGNSNGAPVANDGSANTNEDTAVAITLTATDPESDPLTYTVVTGPTNGTLSGTAPNLTYTPDGDFNGSDSFTFKANDTLVDSNTATVSITVNAINDAPVASNDSAITEEDTAVAITLVATDIDSTIQSYTVVSGPSNGVLSGTAPNLTYTPNGDYNGADSFTFTANDGTLDSNTATISITVNAVNDAPVFTTDPVNGSDANEDSLYSDTLAGSASDADNDPLTYSKVSGPAWLAVNSNGAFSGVPTQSDLGINTFTVSVNDGNGGSDTATLNISVISTNDAPVFTADPITGPNANEGEAYSASIGGSATDEENDPLTYAKTGGPAWLNVATNGALSGTPGSADVGVNTFTVSVSDGNGGSDTATLNIEVIGGVAEDYAYAEILVAGTLSGSIADTFTSDNTYESITETETNGKPTDRYSYLEQKWEFDVAGGASVSFHLEAHHSANGEGDDFVFAYSTTGVDGVYTDMLTVTKTSDDNTVQTFSLPTGTSGVVHLRAMDTDRTSGNRNLDTLFIDHMYILSEPTAP